MSFVISLVNKYGLIMLFILVGLEYACFPIPSEVVLPFLGFITKSFNYNIVGDFSEGLAYIKKDKKYGYIDKSGKEVIPAVYNYVSDFSEGVAAVEKDGKYGYIDKSGKEVVPFDYDVPTSKEYSLRVCCGDYNYFNVY